MIISLWLIICDGDCLDCYLCGVNKDKDKDIDGDEFKMNFKLKKHININIKYILSNCCAREGDFHSSVISVDFSKRLVV